MTAPDSGARTIGSIRRCSRPQPFDLASADRVTKAHLEARAMRRAGYRVTAQDVLDAWDAGVDADRLYSLGGGQ